MPIRVQRRRTKGYKLPGNTFSVCRPGRYGNMFKLEEGIIYLSTEHRKQILDPWIYFCPGDAKLVQDLFTFIVTDQIEEIKKFCSDPKLLHDISVLIKNFDRIGFDELKGKNLACFCSLDFEYCHADVLLKIANK